MLTGNRPGAWLRLARHEMACLKERGDTAHLGIDAHTLACRRSVLFAVQSNHLALAWDSRRGGSVSGDRFQREFRAERAVSDANLSGYQAIY